MIDFLVFAMLVLAFILVAIAEHKQKMERLEFEEKIAWMRYQIGKNRDKGDINEKCKN